MLSIRTSTALLLFVTYASAQINSGIVTGIVTDPQKAAVPHAKVEVVEDDTRFSYSTTTNSSGEFTVPYLKAGVYTVTVSAKGFPVYRVSGVTVQTVGTVRTDIPLQLSKVSTQVEVSAAADQLQSDTTVTEGAVSENVINSVLMPTRIRCTTRRCWMAWWDARN